MLPIAAIELGVKAWQFGKENAKPILAGTSILFLGLWSRSCIQSNALSLELEACLRKEPAKQIVYVKQDCKQAIQIVYKNGSPCPEVTATNDSQQAANVTQTATGGGNCLPQLGPVTLGLGAAYYQGLWHPAAGVGVAFGRVAGYELGVAGDVAAAAFTGEQGLYPMGMVKMTVRRYP